MFTLVSFLSLASQENKILFPSVLTAETLCFPEVWGRRGVYPVASPGAWGGGGRLWGVTLGEKTLYSLGPGWRGRQSGLAEEVKLFPFFL